MRHLCSLSGCFVYELFFPRKVSVILVYRVWRARCFSSPLSASLSMIEAAVKMQ